MIGWNRSSKKEMSKPAEFPPVSPLYEGDVRLEIRPFESFVQIHKYTKYLARIPDIHIVENSWSEEEGYSIVVSVQTPVALGRLLENMPGVAHVQYDDKPRRNKGQPKVVVVVDETVTTSPQQSGEPALV